MFIALLTPSLEYSPKGWTDRGALDQRGEEAPAEAREENHRVYAELPADHKREVPVYPLQEEARRATLEAQGASSDAETQRL